MSNLYRYVGSDINLGRHGLISSGRVLSLEADEEAAVLGDARFTLHTASSTTAGVRKISGVEFTRPSDTTAYAAGDSVNQVTTPIILVLPNIAPPGGKGKITSSKLIKSTATVTLAQFRAYFLCQAPAPIADNAAYTLLWADREFYLGYADFTLTTEGAGSDAAQDIVIKEIPFVCVSRSTHLFAVIIAKAAYVPASAEKFRLEIAVEQYE